jgi:Tol biopolymer transport system component/C-terminal processing protease CtpA/Prc
MSKDSAARRGYFRTPTLTPDGQSVAFVHSNDIWIVPITGGWAERLTANPAVHYSPRFSPDGGALAFGSTRTGHGDIYVLPMAGGEVRQLTFHDVFSDVECWSPDGRWLYATSHRDQQGNAVYKLPAAGGTPIRLFGDPYESYEDLAVSPDGSRLAFANNGGPWWRRGPSGTLNSAIWTVGSQAGAEDFRPLVTLTALNRWPLWAPDGAGLYFVSDRDGAENLWFQPFPREGRAAAAEARQLTRFRDGRLLWPAIDGAGRTLVFERDFGIWRCDLTSGEAEPLRLKVRSDYKWNPVRVLNYSRDLSELRLAPDGKKIAFVIRGELFADFAEKDVDREKRQGQAFRLTNTPSRESDLCWTPDSKQVVYVSDRHGEPELFCYDFATRAEQRLTDSPVPKSSPCISPDGKWIAYMQGHDTICLLEQATGATRIFCTASFYYTYGPGAASGALAWSPDSRWLAYVAQDEHFFSNLYVQHIDGGEPRQITFLSNLHAGDVLWAANGRFVVYTTGQYRAESQIARVDVQPPQPSFREEEFEKLFGDPAKAPDAQPAAKQATPADPSAQPVEAPQPGAGREFPADEAPADSAPRSASESPGESKEPPPEPPPSLDIVFDGIERRLQLLTPLQMDAKALAISPDSRDLIFLATVAGKTNLWTVPLDEHRREQSPRQFTASSGWKSYVGFAPDGKKLYHLEDGQVLVRRFPEGDGQALPISAELTLDFEQEKLQIFAEAWRLLRDNFYDPTFRGVDWNEVRERFAPLIAGVQTRTELWTLLNLMCGELRASHTGVVAAGGRVLDGYVGLLFDPVEQEASGRLRVAQVVLDSPAAVATTPVQAGEYLLAVDGAPITPETCLDQLLGRTVGRRVLLTLAKDAAGSERHEVAVRPIDSGAYNDLRYRAWVHYNEGYVHQISEGRLGYVHIRAMSYEAYLQFLADLDAEAHGKQGIVVDLRFNGGGHIASFILDVLSRRSHTMASYRGRAPLPDAHLAGNRVLDKPTIVVVNEHSGSNTEMFTEAYRRMGLGKVVGRTTAGAVIWTWSQRLLDGSTLRLPRIRVSDLDDADLEGCGRPADIDVDRRLGEAARGVDSQLDTAVRALLEQIDSREEGTGARQERIGNGE